MIKNITKKENGITLIALIITIIILVILAAVSIRAAYNSGIIDYSINGTKKYQEEAKKEESTIKDIEEIIKSTLSKINSEEENSNSSGITINLSISGTKLKDNQTALAGLPTITAGTQANTKSVYTDSAGEKAIIPSGFTVSTTNGENTISDGLVICDDDGNEFVWIPVDQDQVISLSVTSGEDITSIELYSPYGDKLIDLTDQGKRYSTTINTYGKNTYQDTDCANGRYVAIVTTENEEEKEALVVRSLYATDSFYDYYSTDEFEVMHDYNVKWYIDSTEANGERLIYSQSINDNGGFYVGRYEAGAPTARMTGNINDTASQVITANGIPVCKRNQTGYNFISRDQAKGLAESMYNNSVGFTCTLLTGAAWDRTLDFLTEPGTDSKTIAQIVDDSTSWGNYYNTTFTVTNTNAQYYSYTYGGYSYTPINDTFTNSGALLTTGAVERNKSKNIYDLAGNLTEWASEIKTGLSDPPYRQPYHRGGSYGTSYWLTASDRGYDTGTLYGSGIGFRPAIFITD